LNGMFAFAVCEPDRHQLLLVRDHLGVKPMYYRETPNGIEFSSEPAGWMGDNHRHSIRPEALIHFLRFNHTLAGSETLYQGIHSLEPGRTLTVNAMGNRCRRWHQPQPVEITGSDPVQLAAKLRHLLHLSVGRQMVADSAAGVMLSGGVDSTILTGLLSQMRPDRVRSYSIALEGDEEDLKEAAQVAQKFHTLHESIIISPEEFFLAMDELTEIRKLPVALPNEVLIYSLSKRAANNVKFLISGEGADELFGGYSRVLDRLLQFSDACQHQLNGNGLPLKAMQLEYPQLEYSRESRFFESCYSWFTIPELLSVLKPEWHHLVQESAKQDSTGKYIEEALRINPDQRFLELLLNYHLPHLLQRLDGATMAASIEGRVPFLDHALVDFVRSVPMNLKYRSGGAGKEILRRAFTDLIGDRSAARRKKAFHASPRLLFQNEEGHKRLNSMMARLEHDRFFDVEGIRPLLNRNTGQYDCLGIWLVYSLSVWLNRNVL
jgi:asparagine synthase (glutamine-hydrolysing)